MSRLSPMRPPQTHRRTRCPFAVGVSLRGSQTAWAQVCFSPVAQSSGYILLSGCMSWGIEKTILVQIIRGLGHRFVVQSLRVAHNATRSRPCASYIHIYIYILIISISISIIISICIVMPYIYYMNMLPIHEHAAYMNMLPSHSCLMDILACARSGPVLLFSVWRSRGGSFGSSA